MTEEEWLAATASNQYMVMVLSKHRFPRTKSGRRKLRLFACNCCRVAWDVIPDERLREAVRVAENFADGHASKDELAAVRDRILDLAFDHGIFGRMPLAVRVAVDMAIATTEPRPHSAAFSMTATAAPLAAVIRWREAHSLLCHLLRDIFGNPFRPVTFPAEWRTEAAVGIAAKMYESREFGNMPVLADALQDAGCEEADILAHCRDGGTHVRGCWVVDLVLGKA